MCFYIFYGIFGENICFKSIVFCDVTLCSLLEVHLHFRGIYCLHPQCKNMLNKHLGSCSLFAYKIFDLEDGGSKFLQNVCEFLPDCAVSLQEVVPFIAITVRNSKLTKCNMITLKHTAQIYKYICKPHF